MPCFGRAPAPTIPPRLLDHDRCVHLPGGDRVGNTDPCPDKSGNGAAEVNAEVEGGSFGTFNQDAGVSGSTGSFHYAANIEHLQSAETPVTPLNLLTPNERRNDDAYDNVTASTKLGYDLTRCFDLGLVARYSNTKLRFTGDGDVYEGYPNPIQSRSATLQYYTRGLAHLSLPGPVRAN